VAKASVIARHAAAKASFMGALQNEWPMETVRLNGADAALERRNNPGAGPEPNAAQMGATAPSEQGRAAQNRVHFF